MVNEIVQRLSRLTESGSILWVEGDRLHYRGPVGVLTPADERFFMSHRDQIIGVINDGVPVKCTNCGGVAVAKPDERWDDPQYNDLWQGRCECGCVFSTAKLIGVIESRMVN